MNVLDKYSIPFKGLAAGDHGYEFEAGKEFFEHFENPEITGGQILVTVILHKESNMLRLDFTIRGNVSVPCDRCLEDCNLPVDFEGLLAVKFTEELLTPGEEYDGEVLWLQQSESALNVAQYIYESVMLSLPYQRIHGVDQAGRSLCDPRMLEHFEIVTEEEFDSLTSAAHPLVSEQDAEKMRKILEEDQKD